MNVWEVAAAADALIQIAPTGQLRKLIDVMQSGPPPAVRHTVNGFASEARPLAHELLKLGTPADLAVPLAAAVAVSDRVNETTEQLQLVWTGPKSVALEPRPTSEVVHELVSTAKTRLTLATYSASGVEELTRLLLARKKDGVDVRLLLEQPSATGEGPDSVKAFGAITHIVTTLLWPREVRPKPAERTTMHVKMVIRDDDAVLISSANLSKAAMDRSMELGVRIEGGQLPRRLLRHVDELVERGVLRPLASSKGT